MGGLLRLEVDLDRDPPFRAPASIFAPGDKTRTKEHAG